MFFISGSSVSFLFCVFIIYIYMILTYSVCRNFETTAIAILYYVQLLSSITRLVKVCLVLHTVCVPLLCRFVAEANLSEKV